MEHPGFNSSPFEAPSEKPADSEKKSKKKKKIGESAQGQPVERSKKEQIAEQTKPLWSKLVGEEETSKPEKQEISVLPSEKPELRAEGIEAVEADNGDTAVETLSESEQAEAAAAYIEPRLAELRAGRSEQEDPADAAAREANIELLEDLQAQAVEQSTETTDSVEMTTQDYELREEQPAEESNEAQEFEEEAAIPLKPRSPLAGNHPPVKPPKRPPSGIVSGGNAGGTPPPRAPFINPNQNPQSAYPAAANLAPNPDAGHTNYQPDYRQNPNANYLLVGGLVGYFIGRRRGRIKTEKRMKVVQDKLEKQISETQRQVADKELQVQKLAREQYWQQRTATTSERPSQPSRITVESKTEQVPIPRPAENMTAATPAERAQVVRREQRHEAAPKQTKELSKQELLAVGERVKIGDTNLKRIYEAKLISESGLKRLVHEHIENKDIRRGLAREFLAKELSYERDPRFRDLVPGETGRKGSGGTKGQTAALDAYYLQKLAAHAPKPDADASRDSVRPQATQPTNHKFISNGLLAALTLVALGLAVYAVLLSLSR